MSNLQFLFGTGPEGATLAGAAGEDVTSFNSGTGVFAAAVKGNGSAYGGKYTSVGQQTLQRFAFNATDTDVAYDAVITLPGSTPTSSLNMVRVRSGTVASGGSIVGSHIYSSSGNLAFNDSTGTGISALTVTAATLSAAGVSAGSKIFLRAYMSVATTGSVNLEVYNYSNSSLIASRSSSSANLGTAAVSNLEVGMVTALSGYSVGIADLQLDDGRTTFIPAISAAPTVSLNPFSPMTAEPQETVSLTAVPATGSATPTSYNWTQVSGPSVGLSAAGDTATFEAPSVLPPNSGVVVIGVTGTNGGNTSAQRQAQITVYPQTEWLRQSGGQWVGAKLQ